MELIFYSEAAKILGRTEEVIRNAVSRGEFTKATPVGNRQRLIQEQVMLYVGKNPRTGNPKQLRFSSLSSVEQALWKRYEDDFRKEQSKAVLPDMRRLIREEIEKTKREDAEKAKIKAAPKRLQEIQKQKQALAKEEEELLPLVPRELQPMAM